MPYEQIQYTYLHVYKVNFPTSYYEWEIKTIESEDKNWQPSKGTLLNSYRIETDGTLHLLKKPVRLFTCGATPSNPAPQSAWNFKATTNYWEVMPNGDYRKLSKKEIESLRTSY